MIRENIVFQFKARRSNTSIDRVPVSGFPESPYYEWAIVELLFDNDFEKVSSNGTYDNIMRNLSSVDGDSIHNGSFCLGNGSSLFGKWIRIHVKDTNRVWFMRTGRPGEYGSYKDFGLEYTDMKSECTYKDYKSFLEAIENIENKRKQDQI